MKKGNVLVGARAWVVAAGLSVAAMGNAQTDPVYAWTNFVGQPGNWGSADGIGDAAQFHSPGGVALDAEGNLFVADTWNNTIRAVTPEGVVRTLAGQAETQGTADGVGSTARFFWPAGIAVDRTGSLQVADHRNHTIRIVTPAGVVTTLAGSGVDANGDGNPDWGSADGTGRAARFYNPAGVALDSEGDLYVADYWNHTIRRVTSAGEVTTFAGSAIDADGNDQPDGGSADGTGSEARFYNPAGVAMDNTGNLYVADYSNHTIRKVTTAGVVTTLAGSAGDEGSADGTGGLARFDHPFGVAVDIGGNVFVADSLNHTIRKVTPAGVVTTLGGVAGSMGSVNGFGSSAQFNRPHGIAVDRAGNLYVADSENQRITKGVPFLAPVITVQPAGLTNNPGTTATFTVEATGTAPLDYRWSFNGTNLPDATHSSLTLTNVQITDAGNYTVKVTNPAGGTVSSNALLTVNLPPTVTISSPTNGTVLLAPASFTLLADATDDMAVAQVEFWSETNSLGVVTAAPWYVVQTNLPAGEYYYAAVAVDILGLVSTSSVSTVTVISRAPTEAQPLVTDGLLVRQTGLFYQTVRVSNPTAAPLAALRLWVELDANSLARSVQVWNATGRSNDVPYLSYNMSLAPGESVDLQIEYYVADRRTFPNPVFRAEVVAPDPPFEPAGTALGFVRQVPLTGGLFLVEFSTTAGRWYYVQYSSDMTDWKTAPPAVMGTGSRVQWIDTGPPKTESLPSSGTNRFYRVLLVP